MRTKIILFFTLLIIGRNLTAQDTITMNLMECMRYAVEHSTQVRTQAADNRDAQINRRDAILQAFTPTIEGNSYAYLNWGRSIDPETNTYTLMTSFHNGFSIAGGITLFNGFQAVNNMKITKTAEMMGKSQTQQIEDRICLATMEAYCNVLYYNELKESLKAQTETAENMLRLAQRREELGQTSHADVIQIHADLADIQYKLTTCENKLNDAIITLKDIMFWPIKTPLQVKKLMTTDDIMPLQVDTDINTLITNAKSTIPSMFLAEAMMNNARISLKTARWQMLPRLSLYGGWSSSYFTYPSMSGYVAQPYWDQISNNGGEYVQLSLSIPIFDRLSRHSDIEKKKNAYDRAVAEYEHTLQTIEAEVMRAVADRDGAAVALQQAQTRAEAQSQSLAVNSRRFEQGLISSIEYQTVLNNYLNAVAEQLNARLQYFIRNSVVQYYKGISYLEQDFDKINNSYDNTYNFN